MSGTDLYSLGTEGEDGRWRPQIWAAGQPVWTGQASYREKRDADAAGDATIARALGQLFSQHEVVGRKGQLG